LPEAPPGNDEARLRAIIEEVGRLRDVESRWKAGRAPIAKVADAAEGGLRRIGRAISSLKDEGEGEENDA
jgi:hypothetical protein